LFIIKKVNILVIVFIISLLIRFGYAFYSYQNTGIGRFDDDWDYISYATAILNHGIWLSDISLIQSDAAIISPGFPLILAGIFYIFGQSYITVFLINSIISSIMVLILFGIGKELFNTRVGLMASSWSSFYILFIYYIPTCLKEIWLFFFLTLCTYLFILDTKRNKITWRNLNLILTYTFFIHLDERFFSFLPIFALFFLILDQEGWKKGLEKAILFFVLVCLLMVPWTVRNYNVYKRVVILAERTSILTDKLFGYDTNEELLSYMGVTYDLDLFQTYSDSIVAGYQVKSSPKGLLKETLIKGIALGYIPHKFSKNERRWVEFKEYWRPMRFKGGYINHGFRFQGPSWTWYGNLSRGLTYGLLLPFFIIGISFIIKSNNKFGYFLLISILVHMFIHIELYHVVNRYRIQIDPLVILVSFYAIDNLYTRWKPNSLKEIFFSK
tara:strand:+ start:6245 stop:7567 length:1323 start_codon:yes stop_codon:yes gene_type:complete